MNCVRGNVDNDDDDDNRVAGVAPRLEAGGSCLEKAARAGAGAGAGGALAATHAGWLALASAVSGGVAATVTAGAKRAQSLLLFGCRAYYRKHDVATSSHVSILRYDPIHVHETCSILTSPNRKSAIEGHAM